MSEFRLDLYGELADCAKSLGHPHRLLLLEHIAQGERSVERLAELSDLSVANASQHLQQLRRSGFVRTRRHGTRVLYRLGDGPVIELVMGLRQYADHARGARDGLLRDSVSPPQWLEAVSRDELIELLDKGSVTLLDVRPEEEFDLGHLPGATNIPAPHLAHRIEELDPGKEIVAYCRGPYCVLSAQAAKMLSARGFRARRLVDGIAEWRDRKSVV